MKRFFLLALAAFPLSLAAQTPGIQIGAGGSLTLGTSGLPITGGTLTGQLNGTSASFSGSIAVPTFSAGSANAVLHPDACANSPLPAWCSGATVTQWISAACNALPAGGGTLDMRGFGAATETLSGAILCGSTTKPVTMVFDPATVWVPANATTDVIDVQPRNIVLGLNADTHSIAGYSASCVALKGVNFNITPYYPTALENITCNGTGLTTGNGLLIQSDDTNPVQWIKVRNFNAEGYANGVYLHATGTGTGQWITDVDVQGGIVRGSVIGFNLQADKGNLEGNRFVNTTYQNDTHTSYGLQMLNPGGGTYSANEFLNVNIFDTTAAINMGTTGVVNTYFQGRYDGTCTGPCGGSTDAGYNTFLNSRVAGYSVAYHFGSNSGIWLNSAAGSGLRINDITNSLSWQLNPSTTPGLFVLQETGVGTGAEFSAAGIGTNYAGTGGGVFYGGYLYNGTGANIGIPSSTGSGSLLLYGPSTTTGFHGTAGTSAQMSDGTGTTGHVPVFAADGSLTDSGAVPANRLATGYCAGTATSSSSNLSVGGLGGSYGNCTTGTTAGAGYLIPTDSTITGLYVSCGTTGINASSGVFTLMYEAPNSSSIVGSAFTLTYGTTAANTMLSDTTAGHAFTATAGTRLFVKFTTQATETLANCAVTITY